MLPVVFLDLSTSEAGADAQILCVSLMAGGGDATRRLDLQLSSRGDAVVDREQLEFRLRNPFRQGGVSEAEAARAIAGWLGSFERGYSICVFDAENVMSSFRSLLVRCGVGLEGLPLEVIDLRQHFMSGCARGDLGMDGLEFKFSRKSGKQPVFSLPSICRSLGLGYKSNSLTEPFFKTLLLRELWTKLGSPETTRSAIDDETQVRMRIGKIFSSSVVDYNRGFHRQKLLAVETGSEVFFVRASTPEDPRFDLDANNTENLIPYGRHRGEFVDLRVEDLNLSVPFESLVQKVEDALRDAASRRAELIDDLLRTSYRLPDFLPGDSLDLSREDHLMVPKSAADWISLTREERIEKALESGKKIGGGRGIRWAFLFVLAVEKYGYRNALGYEKERLDELFRLYPEKGYSRLKSSFEDSPQALRQAMAAEGAALLKIESDGLRVIFSLLKEDSTLIRDHHMPYPEKDGVEIPPSSTVVAERLAAFLGKAATKDSAFKLRRGFIPATLDNTFEGRKNAISDAVTAANRAGNREALSLFSGILDLMGNSPRDLWKNTSERRTLSLQEVEEIFSSMCEPDDAIAEMAEAYSRFIPPTIDQHASNRERAAWNLLHPGRPLLKALDAKSFSVARTAQFEDGQEANQEEEAELEKNAIPVRCKMCGRKLSTKASVSGMGPTCAGKLVTMLNAWMSDTKGAYSQFDLGTPLRLSEINIDEVFPIMGLRDSKTGRMFAIDVQRKEKDGRFLAIELTDMTSQAQTTNLQSLPREALKVYFDRHSHEIIKIFEPAKAKG